MAMPSVRPASARLETDYRFAPRPKSSNIRPRASEPESNGDTMQNNDLYLFGSSPLSRPDPPVVLSNSLGNNASGRTKSNSPVVKNKLRSELSSSLSGSTPLSQFMETGSPRLSKWHSASAVNSKSSSSVYVYRKMPMHKALPKTTDTVESESTSPVPNEAPTAARRMQLERPSRAMLRAQQAAATAPSITEEFVLTFQPFSPVRKAPNTAPLVLDKDKVSSPMNQNQNASTSLGSSKRGVSTVSKRFSKAGSFRESDGETQTVTMTAESLLAAASCNNGNNSYNGSGGSVVAPSNPVIPPSIPIPISHGLPVCYKYCIVRGNNSLVVRQIFRHRLWWSSTDQHKLDNTEVDMTVNLLWTQWRTRAFFKELSRPLPCHSNGFCTRNGSALAKKEGGVEDGIDSSLSGIVTSPHVSKQLKLHNHLENNGVLSNKKGLYKYLKKYCESTGNDLCSIVPLTFHIVKGSSDPAYKEFELAYESLENRAKSDSTRKRTDSDSENALSTVASTAATDAVCEKIECEDEQEDVDVTEPVVDTDETVETDKCEFALDQEGEEQGDEPMDEPADIMAEDEKERPPAPKETSSVPGSTRPPIPIAKHRVVLTKLRSQSSGSSLNQASESSLTLDSGSNSDSKKRPRSRKCSNLWIVKPAENTNRGTGIEVTADKERVKAIVNGSHKYSYIVQKYLEKPLLIHKRKFDIRSYVLVTNTTGRLTAYLYKDGYLRTSVKEFSLNNVSNRLIHLTNDAVQKKSDQYGKFEPGNKMSYAEFQRYLDSHHGSSNIMVERDILPKMKELVLHSIKATAAYLDPCHRKYCFEIFGYDFMIDSDFKPWLIEVNTNPCLELASPYLSYLIPLMLEHAIRIAVDPLFPAPESSRRSRQAPASDSTENRFELIYDEPYTVPKKDGGGQLSDSEAIGSFSADTVVEETVKPGKIKRRTQRRSSSLMKCG
eukprot:GILJ01008648.1.p1 GENE.GILJ01008648.1~~GILJ01008648.1.p1  ORF type:complete len:946 (-),score=133.22 GILJ01008648.1:104-2941(-)